MCFDMHPELLAPSQSLSQALATEAGSENLIGIASGPLTPPEFRWRHTPSLTNSGFKLRLEIIWRRYMNRESENVRTLLACMIMVVCFVFPLLMAACGIRVSASDFPVLKLTKSDHAHEAMK
jgi:hypothetical protein